METCGDEPGSRFAVNRDIATPMRRCGGAVYAVDLFADVPVRADGVSYRVWSPTPCSAWPATSSPRFPRAVAVDELFLVKTIHLKFRTLDIG